MAKTRTEAIKHPIPKTQDEVISAIRQMGVIMNQVKRDEADMDDQILKIKEAFAAKSKERKAKISDLHNGIQNYCEMHRDELTNGGKVKFHDFKTGVVTWRNSQRVTVSKLTEAIQELKDNGLDRFIRTSEKVNKELIGTDPEAVEKLELIKVKRIEAFSIEPNLTEGK